MYVQKFQYTYKFRFISKFSYWLIQPVFGRLKLLNFLRHINGLPVADQWPDSDQFRDNFWIFSLTQYFKFKWYSFEVWKSVACRMLEIVKVEHQNWLTFGQFMAASIYSIYYIGIENWIGHNSGECRLVVMFCVINHIYSLRLF